MSATRYNLESNDKFHDNTPDSANDFSAVSQIVQDQLIEYQGSRANAARTDRADLLDSNSTTIALDPADSTRLRSKVYVRIEDNADELLRRTNSAGSYLRLDRDQYADISKDLTYLGRKYGALEHVANYFNQSVDKKGHAWKAVVVHPDHWLDKVFNTAPYIDLVPGGTTLPRM